MSSSRMRGSIPSEINLYRFPSKSGMTIVLFLILILDIFLQILFRGHGRGVVNVGISFGLLPGIGRWIWVGMSLALLVWFLLRLKANKYQLWLFAFFLGGLGNLLPRLIQGSVWDYIYCPGLSFWFNLSDVMITAGVIVFLWSEPRHVGRPGILG